VADAFGVKVTGFLAYLMWGLIHVLYLIGWGNRLATLHTWLRALVFITFEEAHEQAQDRPELPTQRAAETPGSTPVQQTAKRAG